VKLWDGNRRDNSPGTAGESGGAGQARGKICLDQRVAVRGIALSMRQRKRAPCYTSSCRIVKQ
jgi:hypothetical protein